MKLPRKFMLKLEKNRFYQWLWTFNTLWTILKLNATTARNHKTSGGFVALGFDGERKWRYFRITIVPKRTGWWFRPIINIYSCSLAWWYEMGLKILGDEIYFEVNSLRSFVEIMRT